MKGIKRDRYSTAVLALAGLINVVFGVWAFFAPHSFYAEIATFPPYNLHFMHDIGAYQIGIGVALLGALVVYDVLVVALLTGAVTVSVHAAAHVMDHERGGHPTDVWGLTLLAALLAVGLVVRIRANRVWRQASRTPVR
jgi:hypothetical protein